jgi:hypothetical protein
MTSADLTTSKRLNQFGLYLVISLLLPLLLFYIDEGNYNLNWTNDPFNRLFFIGLVLGLFLALTFVHLFILKKFPDKYKTLLTSLIAIPIGLATPYIVVFFFAICSIIKTILSTISADT